MSDYVWSTDVITGWTMYGAPPQAIAGVYEWPAWWAESVGQAERGYTAYLYHPLTEGPQDFTSRGAAMAWVELNV